MVQYCGLNVGGSGKLYGKILTVSTLLNFARFSVNKYAVFITSCTSFLHKFCANNFYSSPLFRVGFYSLSTPPITNTKIKYISFIY